MWLEKRFVYILIFLLGLASVPKMVHAQDDETGFLEVRGVALKAGKPLEGAKVIVLKNGAKHAELTTRKNGKYMFEFEFGYDYVINFSAPGFYNMTILVSSKIPSSVKLPFFPLYQFDVPFYELTDATVNKRSFDRPITKVFYDDKIKRFKDDEVFANVTEKEKPTEVIVPITKIETPAKPEVKTIIVEPPPTVKKEVKPVKKKEEPVIVAKQEAPVKEVKVETNKNSAETDAISYQKKKEKREQEIKENRKIKSELENNILKIVAENERRQNEARFKQQALETNNMEVIKIIETDQTLKRAKMEQQKLIELSRQRIEANRSIKVKQESALLKTAAQIQKEQLEKDAKNKPRAALLLPEIKEETVTDIYKTTVITTIKTGTEKNEYRKITYRWGGIYYFRDNESISQQKYYKQVSIYGPQVK